MRDFVSTGGHAHLDVDSRDDIKELPTPIEKLNKHVAYPEQSKGKKEKRETLNEMTKAIKGFTEMSKARLLANESQKQTSVNTGESFVGDDRFLTDKLIEVLNSYDHLDNFTHCKVELFNTEVRLLANESQKQTFVNTGESFVGNDRFFIDKVVEVLNSYDHLDNFTHYKVLKELFNTKARTAFISINPKRRISWMELIGNGY